MRTSASKVYHKKITELDRPTLSRLKELFVQCFATDSILREWISEDVEDDLARLFDIIIDSMNFKDGFLFDAEFESFALYTEERGDLKEQIMEFRRYLRLIKGWKFKKIWAVYNLVREFSVRGKYGRYIYLRFLGVSQKSREKGFATRLLSSLADLSESSKLPLAYETSTGLGLSYFAQSEKIQVDNAIVLIFRPRETRRNIEEDTPQ